jgi:hypothetical protein
MNYSIFPNNNKDYSLIYLIDARLVKKKKVLVSYIYFYLRPVVRIPGFGFIVYLLDLAHSVQWSDSILDGFGPANYNLTTAAFRSYSVRDSTLYFQSFAMQIQPMMTKHAP